MPRADFEAALAVVMASAPAPATDDRAEHAANAEGRNLKTVRRNRQRQSKAAKLRRGDERRAFFADLDKRRNP